MFQSVMMVTMERAAVSSVLSVTMMMCVTMTTIHIDVSECDDGYYGAGCSKQCPFCNHGGACDPELGVCLCASGYMGSTCNDSEYLLLLIPIELQ